MSFEVVSTKLSLHSIGLFMNFMYNHTGHMPKAVYMSKEDKVRLSDTSWDELGRECQGFYSPIKAAHGAEVVELEGLRPGSVFAYGFEHEPEHVKASVLTRVWDEQKIDGVMQVGRLKITG